MAAILTIKDDFNSGLTWILRKLIHCLSKIAARVDFSIASAELQTSLADFSLSGSYLPWPGKLITITMTVLRDSLRVDLSPLSLDASMLEI